MPPIARWLVLVLALVLVAPRLAAGDAPRCRVVDVAFTPTDKLQLVAWIEDRAGHYVDTVYITQETGSYGLGNRPGRFDFNSGPHWPYGRRTTVLPVWAHAHGLTFPQIVFQGGDENNLSQRFQPSSEEPHFCRPLKHDHCFDATCDEAQWDAASCPSQIFTDKGLFSPTATSLYPPRVDLVRQPNHDSASVEMYHQLNPWDAVSQATPPGGTALVASWASQTVAEGAYVLRIEASKEFDFNHAYDCAYDSQAAQWRCTFPPPDVVFSEYGDPYRGQPSVVYQVPFTIGPARTTAATASYAGYGDPTGADGMLRPPDATITTDTPGSGASRLQLASDSDALYRVKVDSYPETTVVLPGAPQELRATGATTALAVAFTAPGVGTGRVRGYEIRIRANAPISEDDFATAVPIPTWVAPADPGKAQQLTIDHLLPETDYYVAVRAYNLCHEPGPLAVVHVQTAARAVGEVGACFVATAAYGSVLANDVELLRRFRDSKLQRTVLGELAVESYYTFGPAIAGVVGESELLRATARDALAPVVRFVKALRF